MQHIPYGLFECLEKEESRGGVKGRRVVERRVEGNDYPSPCLDVFKISKGEESCRGERPESPYLYICWARGPIRGR